MTFSQPTIIPQPRAFPSRIALLAAAELVLIALLLRLSNSPAFFAAAIACCLCSIQLGVLLINRFQVSTRRIRKVARQAEFSSQAVLITDAFGRIKWTNPRFTRLTGFYLSEIAGKTFGMVLHGRETRHKAVETIRRHMRLGQPFDVEVLEYNRAGESLWVSSKGEPIRDSRGALSHYVITQCCSELSDWRIEDLAETSPVETGLQALGAAPRVVMVDPAPPSERVADLTRQLESLGTSDNRDQLQNLVEGLKGKVENCVTALPPAEAETAPSAQNARKFEERNLK
jgi:PAS domain S-box-containing protein